MEECSFISADILSHRSQHPRQLAHRKTNRTLKGKNPSKNSKVQDQCMEWHQFKKSATYYWSSTQNRKYVKFLIEYCSLLHLSPEERKHKKVNLQMSKMVKTRTPTQCHTHHQKMIARYGSIQAIIENSTYKQNGSRKKTCQIKVQVEAHKLNLRPCVKDVIEMKSASEILAIQPLISGENHFSDLSDILEEIYEPVYTTSRSDLMDWIDVDALLF